MSFGSTFPLPELKKTLPSFTKPIKGSIDATITDGIQEISIETRSSLQGEESGSGSTSPSANTKYDVEVITEDTLNLGSEASYVSREGEDKGSGLPGVTILNDLEITNFVEEAFEDASGDNEFGVSEGSGATNVLMDLMQHDQPLSNTCLYWKEVGVYE